MKSLLVVVFSLALMACGKDGGGRQVDVGGQPGSYTPGGNVMSANLDQIIQSVNSVNHITTYIIPNGNIDNQVRSLLFPTSQPNFNISDVQSIELHLDLNQQNSYATQVDQNFMNQNKHQFQMYLKIDDRYSYQGEPSMYFALGKGTIRQATVNNGTYFIQFGDNYGTVNIRVQNGMMTLSFTNSDQPEQTLGTGSSSLY